MKRGNEDMIIELIIMISVYITILLILNNLKQKYVIQHKNNSKHNDRLEELKLKPIKNIKEQKEFVELKNNGSKLNIGFGRFFLFLALFIILSLLINMNMPLWWTMSLVMVYSLFISMMVTSKKSKFYTFSAYSTFISFLFIGFILLMYKHTDFKLNFLLLLVIFYVVFYLTKKIGGLKL